MHQFLDEQCKTSKLIHKQPKSATHTRFIYEDESQHHESIIVVCVCHRPHGGNYIDARCREIDGKSVHDILNHYYYKDSR